MDTLCGPKLKAWTICLSTALATACSPTFMPIQDERIVADLWIPTGYDYGDFRGMICNQQESICGRRLVDEDLYDPDFVTGIYNDEPTELPFMPTGYEADGFAGGYFDGPAIGLLDDQTQTIGFNDLPDIIFSMPPHFRITAPLEQSTHSRAQTKSIRMEWEPSGTEYLMRWKLIQLDNELEELPCDLLDWSPFEGEGEDTGFLDIPMDMIPSALPPEGCGMAIVLQRIKNIALPAGAGAGRLSAIIFDGVVFSVVP